MESKEKKNLSCKYHIALSQSYTLSAWYRLEREAWLINTNKQFSNSVHVWNHEGTVNLLKLQNIVFDKITVAHLIV